MELKGYQFFARAIVFGLLLCSFSQGRCFSIDLLTVVFNCFTLGVYFMLFFHSFDVIFIYIYIFMFIIIFPHEDIPGNFRKDPKEFPLG